MSKASAFASSVPPETREYIDAKITETVTPILTELASLAKVVQAMRNAHAADVENLTGRINRLTERAAAVQRLRGGKPL